MNLDILLQFVHLRMINNVLYGLQGVYQIHILTQSIQVVCSSNIFGPLRIQNLCKNSIKVGILVMA